MIDLALDGYMSALPEIFLALSGLVFLIAGVFRGNSGTTFLCYSAAFAFVFSLILLVGTGAGVAFSDLFIMDDFARYIKVIILLGAIASVVYAASFLKDEQIFRFEYPVLMIFAVVGMMVMVSANDLLTVYLGLELSSLSLYVLAAIHRESIKSSEAGLKYFVLGAISSGFILFGCSLIYGFAGATNFDDISVLLSGDNSLNIGVIFGMVFILSGLAFKISAVPFHMWTPDVYEGAPTSVTAFFAIVPKIAAIALIIRILFEVFPSMSEQWQQVVVFISVASMAIGAFGAIAQKNIKRLMAYSSIGNMGYALIGVAAATQNGVYSVLVYVTIYMVMTVGVFGIIMCMRKRGYAAESISDLSGLSKNSPVMAYGMAILMFSLSGIPPMAGFFGKFMIFEAAVNAEMYILAVIGVLLSVVAAYYYLRVIKIMFFDEAEDRFDCDIAFSRRAMIAISVILIVAFIFYPNIVFDGAMSASLALFPK